MTHYAWPEIESFHNIRKYAKTHHEILGGVAQVKYRAKVKLHGSNAGVQVHCDGRIVAQSRTQELVDGADNAGFAKWVKENEAHWRDTGCAHEFIAFGEWCGKGIQKGVAISAIDKKVFAVFAIKMMNDDSVIVEPDALNRILYGIPDTYVLPWYGKETTFDWLDSSENLEQVVNDINKDVLQVEENDPWVEATFGVKGTGEGLVFYPFVDGDNAPSFGVMSNLMFKAKGEKHKNVATAAPAQVNPETAASVDAFIDMVLTEARLEQGSVAVNPLSSLAEEIDRQVLLPLHDVKLMGKFIAWISNDVAKETQDELEASGLTMKQVQGPLTVKARTWYLAKAKKL